MIRTETPSPPLVTWSLTGKRGRKSPRPQPTHRDPETQDRDIARFLLTLSSPPPTPDRDLRRLREAEAVVATESDGCRWDGAEERRRRMRPATNVRVHECSLCPKRFRTGRALGGHMKSHWERDLHGRVVKKKTRKLSSLLGLGLGLGFSLELDLPCPSPLTPKPRRFSSEGREGDVEYGGVSLAEDPSPLLLPF